MVPRVDFPSCHLSIQFTFRRLFFFLFTGRIPNPLAALQACALLARAVPNQIQSGTKVTSLSFSLTSPPLPSLARLVPPSQQPHTRTLIPGRSVFDATSQSGLLSVSQNDIMTCLLQAGPVTESRSSSAGYLLTSDKRCRLNRSSPGFRSRTRLQGGAILLVVLPNRVQPTSLLALPHLSPSRLYNVVSPVDIRAES